MRALLVILALSAAAASAAAGPVSVYIAPRSSVIPRSGKVVFDVYWFNRGERAATIPSLESYSFACSVVSRTGKGLPRFLGGAVSSLHGNPDRPIPPRTVLRGEIQTDIDIAVDELVEVTAEFRGNRRGRFKSNTVVLVKRR
jgi:hypothetical protein